MQENKIDGKIHNFVEFLKEKDDFNQYKIGFNLFKVLGLERKELIHSKVIAYFLDPKENHELGSLFIESFYKRILDTKLIDYDNVEVHTEIPYRIDIFAINKKEKNVLVIENKIDSDIHESGEYKTQLEKYKCNIDEDCPIEKGYVNKYIFLSPTGYESGEDGWKSISYEEIIDVFKMVLKNDINNNVRNFINNYVELLEKKIVESQKIKLECQEIYNKHKDAIKFILENVDDEITLIVKTLRDLYSNIQDDNPQLIYEKTLETTYIKFRTKGLNCYFKNNTEQTYFYFNPRSYCLILEYSKDDINNAKKYCELLEKNNFKIGKVSNDYVVISKLDKDGDYIEELTKIIKNILEIERKGIDVKK